MYSHTSQLDPICVGYHAPAPCRYIAKRELFKLPIFGQAMSFFKHISINRGDLQQSIETLNRTKELIDKKISIAIAPEGTRRRKPSEGFDYLLEFKKGPFHLALQSKVPITPVVIFGAFELLPPGQIFPSNGTVTIRYLEQVQIEENDTIESIQQKVRSKMLESIRNPPPRSRVKENNTDNLILYILSGFWCLIIYGVYTWVKSLSFLR